MSIENEESAELTQEELAAQFNEEEPENGSGDQGGDEGENKEFVSQFSEDELSSYNDFFGDKFPDELLKNEDGSALSKKEALSNINKAIAVKSQEGLMQDDFIRSYYNASKQEGFNRQEYIKSLNASNDFSNLSSEQKIIAAYKGKYTEEELNKEFEGMTKFAIDQLAEKSEKQVIENMRKTNAGHYKKQIDSKKQEINLENTRTASSIDKYVSETLINNSSLKFNNEQIRGVTDTMKSLMELELIEENGRVYEQYKVDGFLANREKLFKILPYIALEEQGNLDSFISGNLKDIKNKEWKKIESDNSIGSGGGHKGGINFDKLYEERF